MLELRPRDRAVSPYDTGDFLFLVRHNLSLYQIGDVANDLV
ncbi:hypothetical protein F0726_02290 [Acidithiobacillus caldus]|nr:hypothetical protein F0726_02290 [Acidithiobacillus caldus]